MVRSRPLYFMFLSVGVTTIASTGDVQKAAVHQVPNSSWSSSKGRTCYQTPLHKHTKEYIRLFWKRHVPSQSFLSISNHRCQSSLDMPRIIFFIVQREKTKPNKMPDITKTIKVIPFLIASIEG